MVLLAGCASPQAFQIKRIEPGLASTCSVPIPERDVLVGVALSGGGSRAALFGAAGLEALGRLRTADGRSVLERTDYLSSVSGGSLAATYYALQKPPRDMRVLTPGGELTPPWTAFFEQYKGMMSQNIGGPVALRQFSSFRWLNSSLGAISLAEILRERVLGDATMRDVNRREALGDAPGLIVNTTLYNNGRRLAVTGLPSDAFRYDFIGSLQREQKEEGKRAEIPPILARRWEQLLPMTPADLRMDQCHMLVAGAVAASASFPPVIGPTTFQVEGDDTYWHVGDGGLYENQGVEPLVFLFVKQLQQKKSRRAYIIAFDSSFPFSVDERRLNRRAEPFSLFTFDFNRIPGIMEERATTYQGLFFRSMQIEGVFPDEHTMFGLSLRHIDAQWREDLSDVPQACLNEAKPILSPADVRERLAEIPTRFRLFSECDRQLLITAASKLVEQHRQEILDFIDGRPVPKAQP
ncbi:patatin-like phospholipase family protein [Noviherbaspirillum cavernae]|nr:patatin-like phospholipase family protein [Noviherbaspirillum cavernae]